MRLVLAALVAFISTTSGALAQAPLFSKSFNPSTIGPGSSSTLTFTITNDNDGPLPPVTDLAFTDVLPAGMTLVTPSGVVTDCSNAIVSAPDGGTVISLTEGRVGLGGVCTISVNVIGTATAENISGDLTSSAGNSGTASATLTVDAVRPGFTKSFAPSSIPPGGTSALTLSIDNTASVSDVLQVQFIDTLPNGMVVATPSNAVTDCSPTFPGTLNAVSGTSIVSYFASGFGANPVVAAGSTCVVTVDVTTDSAGVFVNTTGELLTGNSLLSSGFASAVLDVPVEFLSKLFSDDPVAPGGSVTLQFTITNPDRDNAATNIAFSDAIDPLGALTGLVPNEVLPKAACGGTLDFAFPNLTLTGASVPAAGSCQLSVPLLVPAVAPSGTYTNTTSAITAMIDGSPVSGNMASDNLIVNTAPTLNVEFTDDPVGAGDNFTIEYTITNTNTAASLSDISFVDELTTFLPFPISVGLPPTPDPPCGAGSTLTVAFVGSDRQGLGLNGGNLAAGATCTFSTTVNLPAGFPGGTYTNTTGAITATIDGIGPVTGLPDSDDLQVAGGPRLSKEFTDDPVEPGANVTLEFTLTHDLFAPTNATGIAFTDDLDATPALAGLVANGLPLNNICGPGSSLTGSEGNSFLTFAGGALANGQSCTFSVVLAVPGTVVPGSHNNTTSAVSATVDGVTASGTAASDQLKIVGLELTKEFIDDPVVPGDITTLRFTIENKSADAASNIFFSDVLDPNVLPGITAALPPTPNPPCGAGSTLTISGLETLFFTGGSLASAGQAGDTCVFDVVLTVPAATVSDTYLNSTQSFTGTLGGTLFAFDNATDQLVVEKRLLQFGKEFTDDPGLTVTLEYSVANVSDTKSVTAIAFTDDLQSALAGVLATGLPAAACGGTVSTPDGGNTIEFTGGSLAPLDACNFPVTLQVPAAEGAFLSTTSVMTGLASGLAVEGDAAIDTLVAGTDFDGDGIIDLLDPDDDNDGLVDERDPDALDPDFDGDGIQDGLDSDPVLSNNACTGADAIFTSVVTTDLSCGAQSSITVDPPAAVQAPGQLQLVAPLIIIKPGFVADHLIVITADPCGACGP